MKLTGRVCAQDIESIRSPFAANMLESLPPSKPRFLSDMFPMASPDALDLLRRCLKFNPSKRITAEEALSHPYVAQFHNEVEEPVYPCPPIRIALDDNTKVSLSSLPPSLPPSLSPSLPPQQMQMLSTRESLKAHTSALRLLVLPLLLLPVACATQGHCRRLAARRISLHLCACRLLLPACSSSPFSAAPPPRPLLYAQFSVAEYRDRLYKEIVRKKKEIRRRLR
jgi:serine/threonine protein kinase